jgi:uncharacterized protein YfcZ (UPF0381/DUF406 family)
MSDAKAVAAMQRQLADAEVERLRLVGELEDMRLRAVQAESMLASVSGVTRLELVAAERATADEAVRYWTEQAQAGANEAAELRAQVEAARKMAADIATCSYPECTAAHAILRAMDEAKP